MNKNRSAGRTFVLIGISGSGKGTQAENIRRVLGRRARVVSTGSAFREIAKQRNFLGVYIRTIITRGGLMPYWAAAYVWLRDFFARLRLDEHIIFEGAVRRIEEAPMLDTMMRDLGRPLPTPVLIDVSEANARIRLLGRGRSDDNMRAIAGRFRFFRVHVTKVIRYYRARNRLITVNGNQSPELVWAELRKKLNLR